MWPIMPNVSPHRQHDKVFGYWVVSVLMLSQHKRVVIRQHANPTDCEETVRRPKHRPTQSCSDSERCRKTHLWRQPHPSPLAMLQGRHGDDQHKIACRHSAMEVCLEAKMYCGCAKSLSRALPGVWGALPPLRASATP